VVEFLIKLTTRENQVVLDPFMGSGTTAAACVRLKRNFIGFEIDKDYFDKSIRRIEKLKRVYASKLERAL
jgi:site-specific DNA-methyltransferase (adenine-specific)